MEVTDHPETYYESGTDPKLLHCFPLPPSISPTHSSFTKPGQRTRTVSPEKATGSQETAPLPKCSQEISTAQSLTGCCVLLTPHSSSEARSGEGGPGWLTSSLIVFQTMGKVPLSHIRDSQHHRPKLGWVRGAVGKEVVSRARWPENTGRHVKANAPRQSSLPYDGHWPDSKGQLSTSPCPCTQRGCETLTAHRPFTCPSVAETDT